MRRIDDVGLYNVNPSDDRGNFLDMSISRREFLLGIVGLAFASSISPVKETLSVLTGVRKIDEVLDNNNLPEFPVYSNEIDWRLNEETFKGLPVQVERVTDPSTLDGPILVLGGPEAPTDENMPMNLVKKLYTSHEVELLKQGRWAVKVGEVDNVKVVNVAGGNRYDTKRGIDFLLGNGNHSKDYNLNGLVNFEEIIRGRNPLEKRMNAYTEKIPEKDGVKVRVYVDHPFPVEAYYSLNGILYKMIYSKEGYYYAKIPNSQVGNGLTITLMVSDVIDDGRCMYSNSKVVRVYLSPTTKSEEETTESETETESKTETERKSGVKEKINRIHCVRQICNTCCLYAAIEMATRGGVTQRQLIRDLGRPNLKDPHYTPKVIDYLEKRGYGWEWYPTRPVYLGFERIIDEGHLPVFVFDRHARTAYGYRDRGGDKGEILYCDPISGKNTITFSRLEELKRKNNLSGPIKISKR